MLTIAHGTHPGETGKNNEDRYGLATLESPVDGPVTLAVVADGIGGHLAGEVASQLAVETITESVRAHLRAGYLPALESAVTAAARTVAEAAESRAEHRGMGTTCAVALWAAGRLYTAYIGDSRIYLLRSGSIRQVSVDHTFVQEAIDFGILTPADARAHPQRHVLRRHMGKDPAVKPDFRLRLADDETAEQSEKNQGLALAAGEAVLLCSDGLSDLVESGEILEAVRRQAPQAAVEALILLARQRGGHDNITLVLLQVV